MKTEDQKKYPEIYNLMDRLHGMLKRSYIPLVAFQMTFIDDNFLFLHVIIPKIHQHKIDELLMKYSRILGTEKLKKKYSVCVLFIVIEPRVDNDK